MAATYLVTGATGNIGRSVTSTLLSQGHKVRAYTRNTSSKAAQSLAALGAELHKGDFNDTSALSAASEGCSGIFIIIIPSPNTVDEVRNVVTTFRKTALPDSAIVLNTSVFNSDLSTKIVHSPNASLPTKPPASPASLGYWALNDAVENVVKESGTQYWTVLHPAWFMSNYHDANVWPMQWPTLARERVLVAGVKPDTLWELSDPHDIGVMAANALVHKDDPLWKHQRVDQMSELLNLVQIAETISRVTGIEVKPIFTDEAETVTKAENDPGAMMAYLHFWQNKTSPKVTMEYMRRFGIPLGTFDAYCKRNKDALVEALNDTERKLEIPEMT